MRLELDILNIQDVRFGAKTAIEQGVLNINLRELQGLLKEDKRLGQVDIELAHPGEKCRILQVSDVIEPRAKMEGHGENFPGALGKHGRAGMGRTSVLRSVSVVTVDRSERGDFFRDPNGEIIDMSGPGAELSIYGKTHNVVVLPFPGDGVSLSDYRLALKVAGLKTAVYLAETGRGIETDKIEVYELSPFMEMGKERKSLPRLAYIFQLFATQFGGLDEDHILYGGNVDKLVPTILHPNEVLDGAIVAPFRGTGIETYAIQNHPVIKGLYRRDGKDLYFAGVIITIAHNSEDENERAAIMAANLAKWVLRADGVVLTKSWGGAPEMAMAKAAHRCEAFGIKTVLAMWAQAADDTKEIDTLFNFPEVNAIVSMGVPWEAIALPPMERIIGKPLLLKGGGSIGGKIDQQLRWIKGALGHLGTSSLKAIRY